LAWLRGAARATARAVTSAEVERHFAAPLRALLEFPGLAEPVRSAAGTALARLEAGSFVPRHVLAHNDLWKGNVLLVPGGGPIAERFVLIDWAGALADGHGLFDLVRLARSFKVSRARLTREIAAHCALLGCGVEDAPSHLAGALARMAGALEHFPPDAYRKMAAGAFETLAGAGSASGARGSRARPRPPRSGGPRA
jgi:hypothetical protein